ncbi:hypothetical protein GM661_13075 [Iocasia frigidifontis]|uniref:Uncharacterized protein n=1 Tax=Iocasia fonsfrigidae TaxID=2682810 RepID=A0A8A7KIX9_9FIRM|nr:hypothetical protein GM661_13075 [Iocasia fonsfrigidae]
MLEKALITSDAVSHAALPGVALAFMFTQRKETAVLLLGALITIKFDSALALVLSV